MQQEEEEGAEVDRADEKGLPSPPYQQQKRRKESRASSLCLPWPLLMLWQASLLSPSLSLSRPASWEAKREQP